MKPPAKGARLVNSRQIPEGTIANHVQQGTIRILAVAISPHELSATGVMLVFIKTKEARHFVWGVCRVVFKTSLVRADASLAQ